MQNPTTPAVQTDNYEPLQASHTSPATTDSGQDPHQTLTPPEPDYELPGPYYSVISPVREGGRKHQSTSNPPDIYQTTIAHSTDKKELNNPEILTTSQYENIGDRKNPIDVTTQYVNVATTQGGLSGETSSAYANVPL